MTVFINCTPHEITLCGNVIPASGIVARCAVVERPLIGCPELDGVPVIRDGLGKVEGLPEPQNGVGIIVSRVVFDRVERGRHDVFALTHFVRDETGKITGANALVGSGALEEALIEQDEYGDGFRPEPRIHQ